jgi:hypothetical protein
MINSATSGSGSTYNPTTAATNPKRYITLHNLSIIRLSNQVVAIFFHLDFTFGYESNRSPYRCLGAINSL